MATEKTCDYRPRASEGQHWYLRDATPFYEVIAANGQPRPATLRDARKVGAYPGITSILKSAAAPNLEIWKRDQLILAARTLPRMADEADEAFWIRVIEDSQEQGRKARDRGTEIHTAIQGHFDGMPPSEEMWPYVQGVVETLRQNFGDRKWIAEKPVAHPLGFGTKSDLHEPDTVLLDFKGKDFTKAEAGTLKLWDDHYMQLAATAAALGSWEQCAIVYVSRTEPGLARVCYADEHEIKRGWEMFSALIAFWKAKNKYWPELWQAKEAA